MQGDFAVRNTLRETLKKSRTVIDLTKYRYFHLQSPPLKQITFADAEYSNKRKQTRKEFFLEEMEQVVPWKGLIGLIEPHYSRGEGGRPSSPPMAMLRVHLLQNWFGYSDPAMEEALYETTILRQFAGLELNRVPDETGQYWNKKRVHRVYCDMGYLQR